MSDRLNWDGGSPANDPDADLTFGVASRLNVTNDLPALAVHAINVPGSGYTVSGNAIRLTGGTLSATATGTNTFTNDLLFAGSLTIRSIDSPSDPKYLRLSGSIRGDGDVMVRGYVDFGGAVQNAYPGRTTVIGGILKLNKSAGVLSVPGDLYVGGPDIFSAGSVHIGSDEQIADTASITVGPASTMGVSAVETVGPVNVGANAYIASDLVSGVSTPSAQLRPNGDWTVSGESARVHARIALQRTLTLTTFSKGWDGSDVWDINGTSGVIVRSADNADAGIRVDGSYTGPTIIEGSAVYSTNVDTAVIVRGGRFTGKAASITVESGQFEVTRYPESWSRGNVALRPSATFAVRFDNGVTPYMTFLQMNGTLDLGGSRLVVTPNIARSPGTAYFLVINNSPAAVQGTFAGLPEGAVVDGRFRISYRAGDGNDVTLTEVGPLPSTTTLTSTPKTSSYYFPSEDFTLKTDVRTAPAEPKTVPTGSVVFKADGVVLGTATLTDGTAALTARLPRGEHVLTASYSGDAQVAASDADALKITVLPERPVISSVEPTTVKGGTHVTFTIRGSEFLPNSTVFLNGMGSGATFISSSELRYETDAPWNSADKAVNLYVQLEGTPAVFSNSVSIMVTAGDPLPAPDLKFEANAVVATVTPGASTAWVTNGTLATLAARTRVIADDDRDGVVRWQGDGKLPNVGVWVAVDMSSGKILAARMLSSVRPSPRSFPHALFVRDASGEFGHVILGTQGRMNWTILLVRPGVGVWAKSAGDGWGSDLDESSNSIVFFDISSMIAVGKAPPVTAVRPGDIFVAMNDESGTWLGDKVDDHLAESAGAGNVSVGSMWQTAHEEKGIVRIPLMRTDGSDGTATVKYATVDGSALAGRDYTATAGTATFGAGEVVQFVEVPLTNDDLYSGSSMFKLALSDAAGASLTTASTTITLIDAERPPELTIADVSVQEGDSGTVEVPLQITLKGARPRDPISLYVKISAPTDPNSYGEAIKMLLAPGETSRTVRVPVNGNTIPERDTTRNVIVSTDSNNVALVKYIGVVTINDDDFAALSIDDVIVNEKAGSVTLGVRQSPAGSKPITVRYATADGTASADADYKPTSGMLKIDSSSSDRITIPIVDDLASEGAEWFTVTLSDPTGASLGRPSAVVMISDDEPAVTVLRIEDASTVEGTGTSTPLRFRVVLSALSDKDVIFTATSTPGTAASPADFAALDRQFTIAAGKLETFIDVAVVADSTPEADETFTVRLSNANAVLGRESAMGTIEDDDGVPRRRAVRR